MYIDIFMYTCIMYSSVISPNCGGRTGVDTRTGSNTVSLFMACRPTCFMIIYVLVHRMFVSSMFTWSYAVLDHLWFIATISRNEVQHKGHVSCTPCYCIMIVSINNIIIIIIIIILILLLLIIIISSSSSSCIFPGLRLHGLHSFARSSMTEHGCHGRTNRMSLKNKLLNQISICLDDICVRVPLWSLKLVLWYVP